MIMMLKKKTETKTLPNIKKKNHVDSEIEKHTQLVD